MKTTKTIAAALAATLVFGGVALADTNPLPKPIVPLEPKPALTVPIKIHIYKPEISSFTLSAIAGTADIGLAGTVPARHQTATAKFTFAVLDDVASGTVQSITSDCVWKEPDRLAQSNAISVRGDGTASYSREGMFEFAHDSGCSMTLVVVFKRASKTAPEAPLTLKSIPLLLTSGRVVRFEATHDLVTKLGVVGGSGVGSCSGVSKGTLPPFPQFPVGMRRSSRGDIMFEVHSGPIQTACGYRTTHWELPQGVEPRSIRVSVQASDQRPSGVSYAAFFAHCYAGSGRGQIMQTDATIGLSNLSPTFDRYRAVKPIEVGETHDMQFSTQGLFITGFGALTSPDGRDIYVPASGFLGPYRGVLAPFSMSLGCASAVTNDQWSTLTIDSIDFFVPTNVRFP
jgi:hypothetical protein